MKGLNILEEKSDDQDHFGVEVNFIDPAHGSYKLMNNIKRIKYLLINNLTTTKSNKIIN